MTSLAKPFQIKTRQYTHGWVCWLWISRNTSPLFNRRRDKVEPYHREKMQSWMGEMSIGADDGDEQVTVRILYTPIIMTKDGLIDDCL